MSKREMLMLDEKPILYYVAYIAPCGKPAPAFDDEPSVLSNPDAGSDFLDEHCSLLGESLHDAPLYRELGSSDTSYLDLELTDSFYFDLKRGIDYSLLIRGYDSPEGTGGQEDYHTSQMFVPYATFVGRYMKTFIDDDDVGVEIDIVQFKFNCSFQYTHSTRRVFSSGHSAL